MLHDLLGFGWGISGVLLLLAHLFQKSFFVEEIFRADTLISRIIQYVAFIGLFIFAVSGLAGYPFPLLGMPMMHWFSLLFLVSLWFRAALLVVKRKTLPEA
jgi:hypothetical protein